MKRSRKNFVIDSLAFMFFLFLVSTGIILHYLLPHGSGGSRSIWGMSRHDWGDIHFYASIGFLAILAIHLILHWNWIVNLIRGKKRMASGRRSLLGLVGVFSIIAVAVSPLLSPIEGAKKSNVEAKHEKHISEAESDINGSLTLGEVQSKTKVPVSYLIKELGLPESTSAETKLGKLKNQHGFSMDRVRMLIENYKPPN
ncbi:DUF4405 domain-containing protein [Aureitalea sp. L0-47]|uniref:DUF4405 domain-containing protein n=1 Tax=Aureitalea sp. L0-47 TaxID=2816962 RepID=UPI00223858BE|nr:DUF4405 domain-containing protein [Aureitalea sp. L0-47]MCW5520321.1 DUF4405 domain-containing protein [Aureitalea sp. L0-47]